MKFLQKLARRVAGAAIAATVAGALAACGNAHTRPEAAARAIPVCPVTITDRLPHDPAAFTEGLFFRDGRLFESTGLEGQSAIRIVDPASGRVIRETLLPAAYFGEGIVDWGDEIISLTWQNGVGFRWNRATLQQTGSFRYPGEGWALTRNAHDIFMSDGTADLRVLDPATLTERRRIHVTAGGEPVRNLNEIEWVDGAILANIWFSDRIARIDPATGRVTAWIDLSPLRRDSGLSGDDVLNGIAYDSQGRRLMVTGKNWPTLYVIRFGACR